MTLNQRAARALAGRWRVGMLAIWQVGDETPWPERLDNLRVIDVRLPEIRIVGVDMEDPATLGAFLAVVREAYSDPHLYCYHEDDVSSLRAFARLSSIGGPIGDRRWLIHLEGQVIMASSEAEAWVEALEEAPES